MGEVGDGIGGVFGIEFEDDGTFVGLDDGVLELLELFGGQIVCFEFFTEHMVILAVDFG
jgi:hypothetical protein